MILEWIGAIVLLVVIFPVVVYLLHGVLRAANSIVPSVQKIAVAAQLEQTGQHFPRCEMENEGGGYLISFPDFPGVVASGAMPEEAIRRGRDALNVFRSTMHAAGGNSEGRWLGARA